MSNFLSNKDLTFILLILIGLLLPCISAYWIFGEARLDQDNFFPFMAFILIAIPISYRIAFIATQIYTNTQEGVDND